MHGGGHARAAVLTGFSRRDSLGSAASAGAALLVTREALGAPRLASVYAEIDRRLDESVARLQEWIRQPSIAAENRGVEEGCQLTMQLLKDAGFQHIDTKMQHAIRAGRAGRITGVLARAGELVEAKTVLFDIDG